MLLHFCYGPNFGSLCTKMCREPIRYVMLTLSRSLQRSFDRFVTGNSTEIMAFMSDLKPCRVWFSCWGKGCQLECKHNLIRKYEIFQLPTTRGNQDDDSKKLYLQTNNFIFGLIVYDRRDTNRLSWTVRSSVSTESSAK